MYGYFERIGNPGGIWYILAGQMILAVLVFTVFVRFVGEFRIQSE
jgi:hypothetical protein